MSVRWYSRYDIRPYFVRRYVGSRFSKNNLLFYSIHTDVITTYNYHCKRYSIYWNEILAKQHKIKTQHTSWLVLIISSLRDFKKADQDITYLPKTKMYRIHNCYNFVILRETKGRPSWLLLRTRSFCEQVFIQLLSIGEFNSVCNHTSGRPSDLFIILSVLQTSHVALFRR